MITLILNLISLSNTNNIELEYITSENNQIEELYFDREYMRIERNKERLREYFNNK